MLFLASFGFNAVIVVQDDTISTYFIATQRLYPPVVYDVFRAMQTWMFRMWICRQRCTWP